MITDFDDFMIHQAAMPVRQPGLSDRNFYDRYWFNGFDESGRFMFEAGFGRYPHRFVQDGHFSVLVDGVQHSFHASGRAPYDPKDSSMGPLRIEIIEPMRVVRIVLEPNDTAMACDLTFYAKAPPHQEPKNVMYDGPRLIMDAQRFTQFGRWEGWFSIEGARTQVKRSATPAVRDRSWGVRPVGEFEEGAPSKLSTDPAVYWVWSPIHFDDFCTLFLTRQEPDGTAQELGGAIVETYASMDQIPRGPEASAAEQIMASGSHRIEWLSGTRWPKGASISLQARDGTEHTLQLELDPNLRFQLMGIGYQHPEWKHGLWRDELDIGYESWKIDEVEPDEYCTIHVHTLARAQLGDKTGIGILETLCYGRHAPSGFEDLFDGAP